MGLLGLPDSAAPGIDRVQLRQRERLGGEVLLRRVGGDAGVRKPWASNLTPRLCGTDNSHNLSKLQFSQLQKGVYATFSFFFFTEIRMFFKKCYWSIVALQRCVSFYCTAK